MPFRHRFLIRHVPQRISRAHPTPAPVQCPLCPLTFLDWTRLAAHARSHHHDLYICHRPDCHQGFHRFADLRAHVRLRHTRRTLPALCFSRTARDAPRGGQSDVRVPVLDADTIRLLKALAEGRLQVITLLPDDERPGVLNVRLQLHPSNRSIEAGESFSPRLGRMRNLYIPSAWWPACLTDWICPSRSRHVLSSGTLDPMCECLHKWRIFQRTTTGRLSMGGRFDDGADFMDGVERSTGPELAGYDWGHGLTVEEEWEIYDKDSMTFSLTQSLAWPSSSPSLSSLSSPSARDSEERGALHSFESSDLTTLIVIDSSTNSMSSVESYLEKSEDRLLDIRLNYTGSMVNNKRTSQIRN